MEGLDVIEKLHQRLSVLERHLGMHLGTLITDPLVTEVLLQFPELMKVKINQVQVSDLDASPGYRLKYEWINDECSIYLYVFLTNEDRETCTYYIFVRNRWMKNQYTCVIDNIPLTHLKTQLDRVDSNFGRYYNGRRSDINIDRYLELFGNQTWTDSHNHQYTIIMDDLSD